MDQEHFNGSIFPSSRIKTWDLGFIWHDFYVLSRPCNKICDLKSLLCKHTNKRKHTRINVNTHTHTHTRTTQQSKMYSATT